MNSEGKVGSGRLVEDSSIKSIIRSNSLFAAAKRKPINLKDILFQRNSLRSDSLQAKMKVSLYRGIA